MHIRYCRHCGKPVSLEVVKCPHCKGKLMSPRSFKIVLLCMLLTIIFVYGALFYAFLEVRATAANIQCSQSFYTRQEGPSLLSCNLVCTNSCSEKKSHLYSALELTESYTTDSTQVTLSCECACACG